MKKSIRYKSHRTRLRDRYLKTGMDGLADYELLELLLTFSIPRKDVKPLAKDLIERFETLANVFDAEPEDISSVEGMGQMSSIQISLVRDLCIKYLEGKMIDTDVMSNPKAVYDFSRLIIGGKFIEFFMIIFVNAKNEVSGYEVIGEGTVDNVAVYPRKILKSAIKKNASGVILVHNHPSGHPEPSESDRELTKEIIKASATMELRVLDHLIVTRNNYFSFMDSGLM